MSLLQFIASLVSSLAWPVIVLILGFVLKEPLRQLMKIGPGRAIRRLKAGPVEMEWEAVLDEATAVVAEETPPELLSGTPVETPGELAIRNAYPAGAVVRAYSAIEVALYNALAATDIPMQSGRYKPNEAIQQAIKAGILTENEAVVLRDLRDLRNQVAHSPDPPVTAAQATQYVLVADSLVNALNVRRPSS